MIGLIFQKELILTKQINQKKGVISVITGIFEI